MDKATKKSEVAALKQVVDAVTSLVLADYSGLDVEAITGMRSKFREASVQFRVIKNTLFRIASAGTPLEGLAKHLVGPLGIAFSVEDDPAAPAKVCLDFNKSNSAFEIRAGYADGEILDIEGVTVLSKLPSKDQVRGQLLSLFNTPAQQLLGVLSAAQRDLVGVLSARKAELEKGAEAA